MMEMLTIDIVQDSYAKEKTINKRDELFVDECDTLEIYKQREEHIVDPVDWYFYAGDMRLANVFFLEFNEDTMKGIHYVDWNQHVVGSSINPIILLMTILPLYNWKIRKKIAAIQRDLNFFVPGSMMQGHHTLVF